MFWSIYFGGLLVIILAVTLVWLLSLRLRDSSIVDIFWGLGFVIVGWFYFAATDGFILRKLLIITLVSLWGLRLTAYLAYRNIGKPEDFRYRKWRGEHGRSYWWVSYFRVFLLQGVVMWVVSMPLLSAQINPQPATLTILDGLGLLVWCVGFYFEAMGDWQLMRFKANPANKGHVLQSGLWRYTRHPNYFGDATQWWGFYLIAAAGGGWLSILSPLLMTFLLVRVSGVAMLERTLRREKSEYADYIRRTSAFIPMPPRKLH